MVPFRHDEQMLAFRFARVEEDVVPSVMTSKTLDMAHNNMDEDEYELVQKAVRRSEEGRKMASSSTVPPAPAAASVSGRVVFQMQARS